MKKMLVLLGLFVLGVSSAGAVSDPTPNLLGLYFDETADVYCLDEVAPYSIVSMYAVLSNPTVPEIIGFEFAMDHPSPMIALMTTAYCNSFWDPVEGIPYVIYCGYPYPLQEATVLVSFQYLYASSETNALEWTLLPADNPSEPGGYPFAWLPDGTYLPLEVRGGLGNPSAMIFYDCTVDTEPVTWGAIKSVFR